MSRFFLLIPKVIPCTIFLMLVFSNNVVFAASLDQKPSHCAVDEVTYFSCLVRASVTVASLCGRLLDPLNADNSDIALIFRSGLPGGFIFNYPQIPISINENKFIGHHEKPYGGGYVSDEVNFYANGVSRGVYVSEENGVISGRVMGGRPQASSCAQGSITNLLWQLIISLPGSAKK